MFTRSPGLKPRAVIQVFSPDSYDRSVVMAAPRANAARVLEPEEPSASMMKPVPAESPEFIVQAALNVPSTSALVHHIWWPMFASVLPLACVTRRPTRSYGEKPLPNTLHVSPAM